MFYIEAEACFWILDRIRPQKYAKIVDYAIVENTYFPLIRLFQLLKRLHIHALYM
jgi:hypothetical protein